MPADVVIVLNERESIKKKMAEALEEHLSRLNITSSRIPISEKIINHVLKSGAKVCVLDYILGDFSTGLDVLAHLNQLDPAERITPFFFTDEPDIDVAVEALRSGALHYYLIDDPRALVNLSTNIADWIRKNFLLPRPKRKRAPITKLDQLVFSDEASKRAQAQAHLLIEQSNPVNFIFGPTGSGKKTMAKVMCNLSQSDTRVIEKDWSLIDFHEIQSLLPKGNMIRKGQLGADLTLILHNYNFESGELIDYLAENQKKIWPDNSSKSSQSGLYICSENSGVQSIWQNRISCGLLTLPPLGKEGRTDIHDLAQHFFLEVKQLTGQKITPLSAEEIKWLSQQEWTRNLTQLRNVIFNAYLLANSTEKEMLDSLEYAYDLSTQQETNQVESNSAQVQEALVLSHFNYKLVAAQLGCSVAEVRKIELGARG